MANDITGIDWNPAGLASIRDWEVQASGYSLIRSNAPVSGFGLYAIGTAKRFLDNHVIAGSYSPGLSLEFLEPSTFELQQDGPKIDVEKRIIYREEYALGYGYRVTPTVGLGVSARFREQLVTDTELFVQQDTLARIRRIDYVANAWNLDVGLNWQYSSQWTFGIVAKNLFRLTESEIPRELLSYGLRPVKSLRVGAAFRYASSITVALDLDTQKKGGVGFEWDSDQTFQIRQGLFFGSQTSPFVTAATVGLGWSYGLAKFDVGYVHFLNQEARRNIRVDEFVAHGVQDIGYNRFTPDQLTFSMSVSLGRTRDAWAKIEHIQILSEVFPSSYQIHAYRPLGKARIRNVSAKSIEARVSFFVEQYMDAPTESKPYFIAPNEEVEVPFTAIFNEAIRLVPSMVLRAAEVFVKASPAEGYDDKGQTKLIIRGRNDWDGDAITLRNFVTPEEPDMLRFTRNALNVHKDTIAATSKLLEKFRSAALIFGEFASRMTYVNDPKKSKDRVQYPSETLALRGGDCDDMTVAFASLLASVGMSTAFVDVIPPERGYDAHIFMLFDSEVPATRASLISNNPKRYVVRKNDQGVETVWVPIETTALTEGFQRAWEIGAKEYFDYVEVGLGVVRGWVRVVDIMPK